MEARHLHLVVFHTTMRQFKVKAAYCCWKQDFCSLVSERYVTHLIRPEALGEVQMMLSMIVGRTGETEPAWKAHQRHRRGGRTPGTSPT